MQNVPKIVTERLKAAAPAQHPDADTLTAFAERSLLDRERTAVLEHLARCGDCRDIVALALPELESAAVLPKPARTPWLAWDRFAWPTLRWGFAAAGLAILATLGAVQYQHHVRQTANQAANEAKQNSLTAPQTQAQLNMPAAQPPAAQLANNAVVAPDKAEAKSAARSVTREQSVTSAAGIPAATTSSSDKDNVAAKESQLHRNARQSFPSAGGSIGGVIGGPLAQHQNAPLQWQQQTPSSVQAFAPVPVVNQPAVAKASPAPQAAETVEVQSANAQISPETATALPRSSGEAEAEDGSGLRRAKPVDAAVLGNSAGAAQAASGNLGVNGRSFTQLVKMSPVPVPQWTINPTGGLSRSFDQGATWQEVDVTAVSAASNLMSYDSVSVLSKEPTAANKKQLKAAAPVFRAVSAMGMEVWAGGSSGALYHSGDAGNHWTRVLPIANGVSLSGDIVALEFVDVEHGKVTTSTAETWITADDGASWQKQ
jgi:hypothetical protein